VQSRCSSATEPPVDALRAVVDRAVRWSSEQKARAKKAALIAVFRPITHSVDGSYTSRANATRRRVTRVTAAGCHCPDSTKHGVATASTIWPFASRSNSVLRPSTLPQRPRPSALRNTPACLGARMSARNGATRLFGYTPFCYTLCTGYRGYKGACGTEIGLAGEPMNEYRKTGCITRELDTR
jgi:hypothetical protein